MPHLFFNNVKEEIVSKLAQELTLKLSQVSQIESDWFEYYVQTNKCYTQDAYQKNNAYIEVKWFKRTSDIKENIARHLNDYLHQHNYSNVVIYFNELDKDNYYENMEQF
ncbi:MAG: DUF1904 domain-containing protein [Bacilli bacterium]|jgi:phenylpyruvate tautomerase PptA (4-oxalocrotonate tautomerase family)|nr:DUF1904 domain-containing protein [Bacilli bacterium]